MTYAIDRDAICNSVLFGTATPNSNFLQDGLIGADDSAEQFAYDPEKAKSLLAEAGYPDGYDLRITVNTKYPTSLTIATAVQAQIVDEPLHFCHKITLEFVFRFMFFRIFPSVIVDQCLAFPKMPGGTSSRHVFPYFLSR